MVIESFSYCILCGTCDSPLVPQSLKYVIWLVKMEFDSPVLSQPCMERLFLVPCYSKHSLSNSHPGAQVCLWGKSQEREQAKGHILFSLWELWLWKGNSRSPLYTCKVQIVYFYFSCIIVGIFVFLLQAGWNNLSFCSAFFCVVGLLILTSSSCTFCFSFLSFFIYVCVYMCSYVHVFTYTWVGMCRPRSENNTQESFLSFQFGFGGWDSASQAWQQAPFLTETLVFNSSSLYIK